MKGATKRIAAAGILAAMALTLAGAAGVAAVTGGGDTENVGGSDIADEARVYTVKAVGDVIGVYYGGELVLLTDIAVGALPTSDREALSNGIVASEYEKVLALLEDYSS